MGNTITQKEVFNNLSNNDQDLVSFLNLYEKLQKKYGKDAKDIIAKLSKEVLVPVSVFTSEPSRLETLARFLKENKGMEFNAIAELLGRSNKTIWQAYNFSKKKYSEKLIEDYSTYNISASIFKNRRLSNLENLVIYLKEKFNLKFSKIAALIHRDQRTVWTVYTRGLKKI